MERRHQPRQRIPILIQGFHRFGRLPQSQPQDEGLGPTTEARTKSRFHLYHRRTKHETDNGASDKVETAFPTTSTTYHPNGTNPPPPSTNPSPPVILLPLQDANAVPQTTATDRARRYALDLEAKQAEYSMTTAREFSLCPLPLWLSRPLRQMLDDHIAEEMRDRCRVAGLHRRPHRRH
ncbi:hypothetical protein XPA_000413 [Xanthoria parietina]